MSSSGCLAVFALNSVRDLHSANFTRRLPHKKKKVTKINFARTEYHFNTMCINVVVDDDDRDTDTDEVKEEDATPRTRKPLTTGSSVTLTSFV